MGLARGRFKIELLIALCARGLIDVTFYGDSVFAANLHCLNEAGVHTFDCTRPIGVQLKKLSVPGRIGRGILQPSGV